MGKLASSYGAARTPPTPVLAPDDDLEATLAGLWARGRAAHPDLSLEDVAFATHLGRCKAPLSEGAGTVHAEDLFLACAAISRDPAAVAKLQRDYAPIVVRYARPVIDVQTWIDELAQDLWETLLVGRAGARPRLASYSGSGALGGFVGIAARRLALTRLRDQQAQGRILARQAAEVRAIAGDVELGYIKQKYRESLQEAVAAGLQTLEHRERMILRMYAVEQLTVERIARVYDVSQSTVSRWLARARKRVLREARRTLRARVPLSASDFDSLVGLLASQLDLSVSQVSASASRR